MARRPSQRDCARALWLLGIEPPVSTAQLQAAYRARMAQAHPDLHHDSDARSEAANVLSRALNAARDLVSEWIASDREWPRLARPGEAPASDPARADPVPAPVCRRTGLRAGDLVRVWPYDGDVEVVAGTEPDRDRTWVILRDRGAVRSDRVMLAAYQCPACGRCAGPAVEQPLLRPCPDCLADLRALERRPGDTRRVRSAIEARAEAGLAEARALRDERLEQRAESRRRWARSLRRAGPDDLRAALLSAFTNAFDRWTAPV
ncbi:MAG TPA: J domain-containing protein [Gaiellales bacterium]